jgi:hypothetical protein
VAQGHYNYAFEILTRGTVYNAIKDRVRLDADNGDHSGPLGSAPSLDSIQTIGMNDVSGNNSQNFPELGWAYGAGPAVQTVLFDANIDGTPFALFDTIPMVIGHTYEREIKISGGICSFKLTDLNTSVTQTVTHSIVHSGYPNPFDQFEWWNPANLGPFKVGFSSTVSNWAVSTNGGATYTLVSSRAGIKYSDPPWNGTYDVSGCVVSFTPTPVPTPTPTPTPTPNPVPNQCNPAPIPQPGTPGTTSIIINSDGVITNPTALPAGLITYSGGNVKSAAKIELVYWGTSWSSGGTPSKTSIDSAIQTLLSGPYFTKLRQYGLEIPTWRGSVIYTGTNPGPSFLNATKFDVIPALMNAGTIPTPSQDRNILCIIIPNHGSSPSDASYRGNHFHMNYLGTGGGWLTGITALNLTTLNDLTNTISHEIVEATTSSRTNFSGTNQLPGLIMTQGSCNTLNPTNGETEGFCELADPCNNMVGIVGGVTVQGYYSNVDHACVIPTTAYTPTTTPTTPGPAPVPGSANDTFGLKKIYQTKAGGQEWFVSATGSDSRSSAPNHSGTGGSAGFRVQSDQVRWGAFTTSGYNEGSCVTNQATLKSRGYMQSPNDWKNVEITAHFMYKHGTGSSNNGGEHIELMARGAEHHDANGCLGTAYHSNSYPNGRAKFEKELQHTAGYTTNDPQTTIGSNAWSTGQWFGLKACIYTSGTNVKLEQYVDHSVNNNWVKVLDFTDSGSWGGGSNPCGGSASDKITWGGPICFFRWDNIDDMQIRFMSVREIDPALVATAAMGSGVDNQPPYVISTTPVDGLNNVAVASSPTIEMSEVVTPTSVNEQNVKLLDDSWNDVPSVISLGVDNKTITIDPISDLSLDKLYTIRLLQDGVSDLNANAINYEFNSVFTTPGIILRTASDTTTLSESIVATKTAGGSLGTIVYDLAGTSHHTDITTDATDLLRVGMLVGSGATLVGKALTRIIVRLRTGGTSPTGNFQVGIRKADNSFLQFGSTIDVTTLPDDSTDRDYTYDLISNFYPLAVGDRVTIETTNIASGTLSVKKHSAGGIANLTFQDYDGTTWSNESSGYQLAGTFYQQGS